MIKNAFSALGLDTTLKRMLNVIARFSFDNVGRLRTYSDTVISSGTVTTVTIVTQANISIGDTGKQSTAIAHSVMMMAPTRQNWNWR